MLDSTTSQLDDSTQETDWASTTTKHHDDDDDTIRAKSATALRYDTEHE